VGSVGGGAREEEGVGGGGLAETDSGTKRAGCQSGQKTREAARGISRKRPTRQYNIVYTASVTLSSRFLGTRSSGCQDSGHHAKIDCRQCKCSWK
jgi:hypothetical protein